MLVEICDRAPCLCGKVLAASKSSWWTGDCALGGHELCHKVCTAITAKYLQHPSSMCRGWLERMKKRARQNVGSASHEDGSGSWLEGLTVLSWLEPHKTFQNACTMFQKQIDTHHAPIYSQTP